MIRYFRLILVSILSIVPVQQLHSIEIGETLPDCMLQQLNNKNIINPTNHLKGNVVYIDFWASWCPPCAKSFPFLNDLHTKHHSNGLKVIGINLDEEKTDAENFLQQHPADFNIVTDESKQCAQDLAVAAMPSSFLVDRKGIIRHIHLGFRSSQTTELRERVEQLLTESAL